MRPIIGATPSAWMVLFSASLWISVGVVLLLMSHVLTRLPNAIPRPVTEAGSGMGGR